MATLHTKCVLILQISSCGISQADPRSPEGERIYILNTYKFFFLFTPFVIFCRQNENLLLTFFEL